MGSPVPRRRWITISLKTDNAISSGVLAPKIAGRLA